MELLPTARWTKTDSWHVTLKFLGEVPETRTDEVQEVLEEVARKAPRFWTNLTGAGAFPSQRRPRVLWMGLHDEANAFRNLAGRMERKFEAAGFSRERRPFRPHLTLARFKEPRPGMGPGDAGAGSGVGEFLVQLSGREIDRSRFEVGRIVLFESRPGPKGSVYEPRLALPLR